MPLAALPGPCLGYLPASVDAVACDVPWAADGACVVADGEKEIGVQGTHLNPLDLFLRTSISFIWRILSAFLPA